MNNFLGLVILAMTLFGALLFFGIPGGAAQDSLLKHGSDLVDTKPEGFETAVLAGGCFWCVESEYRGLDGVLYTRVGYMGGALENPTYRDITTGKTGHAEVVEVTFDPAKLSYDGLIEFFLTQAHDPTQLNRQGVDVGTQYRSAIFPADAAQKETANAVITRINESGALKKPIVTTIEPMSQFWVAEEYHQQYYEKYAEDKGKDHIRVILKKQKKP